MKQYLETGGFPDIQGTSDRIRIQMLQGYVQSVWRAGARQIDAGQADTEQHGLWLR